MFSDPPKIFLTGKNGAGKSTIIRAVIAGIRIPAGGFVTERVFSSRDGLEHEGFIIRDIATGRTAPIAWFDREGALVPLPEGFERVGVDAIRTAMGGYDPRGFTPGSIALGDTALGGIAIAGKKLIVMDELGFLERDAPLFQEAVFRALECLLPVLGTLKEWDDPFLERVKTYGVRLFQVTEEKREQVEKEARELIDAWAR